MKCQICGKNEADLTCIRCKRKICLLCQGMCRRICEICEEKELNEKKKAT